GEGIGVLLLKRLADAQRDGDRIYAIVKGAAANNDGKSDGPMTPRQGGQLEALQAAYRDAGFSPVTLGYLEAHGTATTVGDVVEVSALRDLFVEAGWAKPRRARPALRKARAELFLLSGARASVVARTARELADALPVLQRSAELADIAWTLSRRAPGDARLAVVADSFAQLGERLAAAA